jgi:hypothetical protein
MGVWIFVAVVWIFVVGALLLFNDLILFMIVVCNLTFKILFLCVWAFINDRLF